MTKSANHTDWPVQLSLQSNEKEIIGDMRMFVLVLTGTFIVIYSY